MFLRIELFDYCIKKKNNETRIILSFNRNLKNSDYMVLRKLLYCLYYIIIYYLYLFTTINLKYFSCSVVYAITPNKKYKKCKKYLRIN